MIQHFGSMKLIGLAARGVVRSRMAMELFF